MTASQVADELGVSKSFISRVKAGTRNFTLSHLAILEEAIGESLPILLMEAIPRELIAPEHRHIHEACIRLLETTGTGRYGMRKHQPKKRRAGNKAA
jgi:transcriptional regulator with XRE-family HTH domain